MLHSLLRVLIALLVGIVMLIALLASPVGRSLPVYSYYAAYTSRSQICPRDQAREGLAQYLRHYTEMDRLAGKVRLVRKDGQGLSLWSTPAGDWWFPDRSSEELVRYAVAQHFEDAYDGLRIEPGDVVMDCGGFIGDYTITALAAGASKVIVVEPSVEALKCIRLNLASEISRGKVVVCPMGIWKHEGRLWLGSNDPANPEDKSISANHGSEGEWIEVTTIDKLVSELNLERLNAIKFDIEGAESLVIAGAHGTLRRFRPRVAVATEHTENRLRNNQNVIAAMAAAAPNYRMRCGHCYIRGDEGIMPETLYFYPN